MTDFAGSAFRFRLSGRFFYNFRYVLIHNSCVTRHTNGVEVIMKNSMLLGAMFGVVAATAIYSASNQNLIKKTKRTLLKKLEDVLD